MRKLLALVLMAGLVWVGSTIYTEGPRQAFGGAFSFLAPGEAAPMPAVRQLSRARQTAGEVQAALDAEAERYEAQTRD